MTGPQVKSGGHSSVLDPTDERMVPESAGTATFWEHVYRYAFASRFVKGKRVLDIACGEGYGTAALHKAGAAHVVGVDISAAACMHVREKYGLDAREGSAENIPLPDNSVDVVVSFETVEHVPNPSRFLDECARILAPGGRLVISTPDKEIYTGEMGQRNPYHCSEMNKGEFTSNLRQRFHEIRLYTQHPMSVAWWSSRTLVCENTPWKLIRGFERVRRALQWRIFPESITPPTEEQRTSAVALILKTGRSRRHLLNKYVVRPYRKLYREKSVYFIATAVR
jgi:ubiquinone/menaquinone biosynthesis C-methylase UbiE